MENRSWGRFDPNRVRCMGKQRSSCSRILVGLAIVGAILLDAMPRGGGRPAGGPRVAYLAREVPRWSAENRCFSCHNNGDGARALFMASGGSGKVPEEALAETVRWLAKPEGWDRNGGDGPSSDKRLARVQFAAALAEAVAVGRVADRSSLLVAAGRLAEDQAEDGSWRLDEEESLGSPATYGVPLATFTALEVLRAADPERTRFRDAIERADRWLRVASPGARSTRPRACWPSGRARSRSRPRDADACSISSARGGRTRGAGGRIATRPRSPSIPPWSSWHSPGSGTSRGPMR